MISSDSPAVPVSATSKELFRGFSYIAPTLDDVSDIICGGGPQSRFVGFPVKNCEGFWVKICGGVPVKVCGGSWSKSVGSQSTFCLRINMLWYFHLE